MAGDEMVGWYCWLNGHEFEQAPGDGDGQGSVACYSPWGHKKLDMIERLKNTVILTSKKRNRKSKMLSIVSHTTTYYIFTTQGYIVPNLN